MSLFKKKTQKNSEPVQDFDHLTPDGELPWGWLSHNRDFTNSINDEHKEYLQSWINAKQQGNPIVLKNVLHDFIKFMEHCQKICKSKGECFWFWYNEIIASQEYIDARKSELNNIETNLDAELAEYKSAKNQEAMIANFNPTITDDMIRNMIKSHPDILQKDFYKLFEQPFAKNALSERLYFMAKEGKIKRIKSGNSYILKVK